MKSTRSRATSGNAPREAECVDYVAEYQTESTRSARQADHLLTCCSSSNSRAMLITVEGLDGAGKTTLITGLAAHLNATVLREPGGVELSERIRNLVADNTLHVDPRAEALLYAAARAQLVAERLKPILDAGETVLLDRFVDSSLAYQGGGRELGIDAIRNLNAFATDAVKPDRTILLRIDPEQGLERIAGREADRLESAGHEFFDPCRQRLRRAGRRRA